MYKGFAMVILVVMFVMFYIVFALKNGEKRNIFCELRL